MNKKEYDSLRYQSNKEGFKKRARDWEQQNKANPKAIELRKKRVKKYISKTDTKRKRAHAEAMRRAGKRRAIPKSLTKDQRLQIKEIYLNCPKGWDVDHISPLKGEKSSGLHVPWNLRYLPRKLNSSKGNRELYEYTYPILKFHLERSEDISGVSGVGIVAYGCVMPSGKVIMEWISEFPTIEILDNVGKLYHIHGHGGKTRIVMDLNTKVDDNG